MIPRWPAVFVMCVACGNATNAEAPTLGERTGTELVLHDVPYAETSSAQRMDLHLPLGQGPHPVVVLVHGGGFFTGDKKAMHESARFLNEQGIAAASINYRLSGEATFPAAVHDGKAAVRFLRSRAEVYGLDAERIGAWGESAGGNLAAMLGTSAGDAYVEDLTLGNANASSAITATLAMFPPVDFLTIDAQAAALGFTTRTNDADSFESQYMGYPVQDDPAQTARANPTSYIDASDGAFFVQAGDADPLIPYTQSEQFQKALTAVLGDRVQYSLLPGAGHGGAAFTTDENRAAIAAFFHASL